MHRLEGERPPSLTGLMTSRSLSTTMQPITTMDATATTNAAANTRDDPSEIRERAGGGGGGVRRLEPDRSGGSVYMLQGSATIVGKMQAMSAMDGTATVAYDPENGLDGGGGCAERVALFENARSLNPAFEDELSEDIAKSEEKLLLNIGGMSFR